MHKFLKSMEDLSTDDIIHLSIFTKGQMEKAVDLFKNKNMRGVVKWYGLDEMPDVVPEGFRKADTQENGMIGYTIQAGFNGNVLDMVRH